MRTHANKMDFHCFSVHLVNENPIRLNVCIPKTFPVSCKRMGFVGRWQRTVFKKQVKGGFKQIHIPTPFDGLLIIFLELVGKGRCKHHALSLFKKSLLFFALVTTPFFESSNAFIVSALGVFSTVMYFFSVFASSLIRPNKYLVLLVLSLMVIVNVAMINNVLCKKNKLKRNVTL